MSRSAGEGVGTDLRRREALLLDQLRALPSLIVAYSGGVDSSYLAWAAHRVLGRRALAVTADSPSYPERHRAMALAIARDFKLLHEMVPTHELERPEYRANPANRCYYCKHELYSALSSLARARGFAAIADGSNADDRGDYRPGRQAAREFGVLSPLDQAALTKADIRELSHEAGLPTWDEPASACLSSRIPYHSEVTEEKLRVIEQAEDGHSGAGISGTARPAPRRGGANRARPRGTGSRARARDFVCDRFGPARARFPLRHARPEGLPSRQSE